MRQRFKVSIETSIFTWGLYSAIGLPLIIILRITLFLLLGLAGLACLIGATYPYPGFKYAEIPDTVEKRETR